MNSNIKTPNRIALALSTAMLLTGVWAASNAFADEQVRSETVKFKDLNVDTPQGVQALYGRIHAAAKRVCFESDPILQIGAAARIAGHERQICAEVGVMRQHKKWGAPTGGAAGAQLRARLFRQLPQQHIRDAVPELDRRRGLAGTALHHVFTQPRSGVLIRRTAVQARNCSVP